MESGRESKQKRRGRGRSLNKREVITLTMQMKARHDFSLPSWQRLDSFPATLRPQYREGDALGTPERRMSEFQSHTALGLAFSSRNVSSRCLSRIRKVIYDCVQGCLLGHSVTVADRRCPKYPRMRAGLCASQHSQQSRVANRERPDTLNPAPLIYLLIFLCWGLKPRPCMC